MCEPFVQGSAHLCAPSDSVYAFVSIEFHGVSPKRARDWKGSNEWRREEGRRRQREQGIKVGRTSTARERER